MSAVQERLSRALVLRFLETAVVHGTLRLTYAGESRVYGFGGGPVASVRIRDASAWPLLMSGSRGFGEAYARALWDSPDLTSVVRVAARNIGNFDRLRRVTQRIREPYVRIRGVGASRGVEQARRDVHAHYDLGNELFASMLDSSMMYSAAYYQSDSTSLSDADRLKLELICEKLELSESDHLVEIGGGWGALAIFAASTRNCRVTTTTLSSAQYERCIAEVRSAGLEHKVTVLLKDYRELEGQFDALVSVEMIESVGWNHFATFFSKCNALLKPRGRMLLQAITIDDRAYEIERATRSFIRTYIFPNGCLPSASVVAEQISRRTDMRMMHHEDLTPHYVRTLQHWRENLGPRLATLGVLGYDDRFRRLWRLYLCYCEAGFAEHRIAVGQTVYAKPRWRRSTVLRASHSDQTDLMVVDDGRS